MRGKYLLVQMEKNYCWATVFDNDVVVEVKPKYKTDSNIFVVSKLKQ